MPRFTLDDNGTLIAEDGSSPALEKIDDQLIHVPHLAPHVIKVTLSRGDEIGIKVIYSSHCWSEQFDPAVHSGSPMLIMDGNRPRVFDPVRFTESRTLPVLLADLPNHRLYYTPADRNFGDYNATAIINGLAYTVFFTLQKDRGKIDGSRHGLVMRIESAYHAPQPSPGMRVTAAAAINAALFGKKLKYR